MSATSATRVSHHRLDPADTSKELKLQPLSRSQVLRLIPAGIFGAVVFGASAKPSFSALPTTEDYAFGTGSKVNGTQNFLRNQKQIWNILYPTACS